RADLAREALEHDVVPFVPERDPHQTLRGRCEQQRTHRGIERAIGDVEEPRRAGGTCETCVQTALGLIVGEGEGMEKVDRHREAPFLAGSLAGLPSIRRRAAMPSAAARRAGASLPPAILARSREARAAV